MQKVDFKEMSDLTCGTCKVRRIKANVAMRTRRRPLDCYKCGRKKRAAKRRAVGG